MSRRETLAAAGVYLLLAIVFVAPALAPGRTLASADYLWSAAPWSQSTPAGVPALGSNPELVDPATVFEPIAQYEANTFPNPPLWDPYIMAGRPLLADAQSAPYSLYTLPTYVLPFWRSLAVSALMKLFVAAFGTFLFARLALGIGFAGGLLAGAVFAFGLFMVAWLPWPLASVWSYLPWLLLLVDRLVRRPSRLTVCGLAALVALQYLGGHPESSFQTLSVVVLFGGFRVVQRRRRQGRAIALKTTALAAGAVLLGTALAALVLVPFVELLLQSSDISQRSGLPYPVTPAKYLLGILLPDYWGRPTQTELSGFLVQRAFYAGTLTVLLVICALAMRRDAERILFAAVGLLALAVVVGLQPFTFLIRLIPGYSVTYNTRLVIFYLFAVAVLAGYGLDDLVAGRRISLPRRPRLSAAWIWGAVVTTPVLVLAVRGEFTLHLIGRAIDIGWGFARMPAATARDAPDVIRMAAVLEWLTFAAVATALVALRLNRRLGPHAFAALAVLVVCADLFRAGMGENPAIPISHATQPATGAIRYLQARTPARFVAESANGTVPITPDTAIRYRLYDARGYDLPVDKLYNALWRRTVSDATLLIPPTQLAPVDARSLRTFDLLGAADILQAPSDAPLREPGLRLAYNGSDARIYSNARALPRAAVVGAITPVGSDAAALNAITAAGFDPARSAITEQPIAGLPAAPASGPAGQARITTYDPEHVVVRAHADRAALLVLSDLAYPGWTATVDGHPARLYRVDYLLRGVRLAPGSHTVQMNYEPASWRFGWIVTLLALAVVAVLAVTGFAARRSAAPA